ncbi:hypothetical protein [Acetobacter sicerae]|uniref:hypothetical protein n=1 Tax=Acetobacter sicerae TaxID=85325 RepID=UPI00156B2D4C|nr:hypothetical protein [Acetobacter sicerae]NHN91804.1 hypothetical protein [Acetobacter sicerae]
MNVLFFWKTLLSGTMRPPPLNMRHPHEQTAAGQSYLDGYFEPCMIRNNFHGRPINSDFFSNYCGETHAVATQIPASDTPYEQKRDFVCTAAPSMARACFPTIEHPQKPTRQMALRR